MAHRTVIYFLSALGAFGVFQEGLTSLIETQQTVMAAVGEEAQLNCQLMQSKDVLQVTWQKRLPEGEKNLATYSNKFGKSVNPEFRNNVEFKYAGLQNSSIVIRKVTEQDEGCYLCLFNIYPEGALTATTCLLLYGLTSVIETQQTVMAAVGEEAQLNCQLMQSKDVLQVTWQKLLPEGEKNLATYSNKFGQTVNPDFRNNVEFKCAGLQNSSIVIRKVMEQDEGCYLCLFNTYPEGALTATTCLLLYGLTSLIETQQTVMAAVGEEAQLNCQLMQSKEVLQVTWQKLLPEGEKNLATYNKYFGQKVNAGFEEKVEFKCAGLQNSSIVIRKVTEQDEGCYRCLFNTYPEGALTATTCLLLYGLTSLIETQQTVMAAVGEEAQLNCQLMQSKDVRQVTWQKLLPYGEKNLATYNKYFGQKVNAGFEEKVEFKCAGLQNSSIVIRKVTEQDEGCYLCLFNTYPEGALTATTCLLLYELHEAILHVGESNSPEEAVVSCSATGRPAPTVTLTVPHHNSSSVTNTNGTVTVTTTAVLPCPRSTARKVGCAVRVLSGPQIEVFTMIPEIRQPSADGFDEKSWSDNSDHNFTVILVLSVVMAGVCLAVIITVCIWLIRKHWNCVSHRDSEENKTPQKPTKDDHEPKTPLMSQENEVRQRGSTGGKKHCIYPKVPSPNLRCKLKLFSGTE
ncbi:uncharacterized protein LOC120554116 isoform X2 [Perca fluviatilis]|uniref:uncharacterized protein LOC120554116 isoform X2 n=1 Tax=Perca fluviatilis TaxID=8168 RepID=UPI0019654933|nr:uncharacterized protein LOC120554116 isoform X2 [Perca fluviatilis]